MKDFKDFKGGEDIEAAAKRVEREYGGKSEKDVFGAIISQAEKGKREGTLKNSDIDNFYNAISPSLSSAQKKKLKKIVEELKKIES